MAGAAYTETQNVGAAVAMQPFWEAGRLLAEVKVYFKFLRREDRVHPAQRGEFQPPREEKSPNTRASLITAPVFCTNSPVVVS